MTPLEQAFEPVKLTARAIRRKWPGDSYGEKTQRAFAGYDWGYVPLLKVAPRVEVLRLLDRSKAFGVSERSIRRVETIRNASREAAALEAFAKTGWWSLEAVEHIVIRGVNAEVVTLLGKLAL